MASQAEGVKKLRDYASKIKDNRAAAQEPDEEEEGAYADRVVKSLRSLQYQVKQHETALEELRARSAHVSLDEPSHNPEARQLQLRAITAAYRSLRPADPLLPSPDSPLPALLALRGTLNLIDQTKISMRETRERVTEAQSRRREAEVELEDARAVKAALGDRIKKLQVERDESSRKGLDGKAKDMMREQERQKTYYAKELRKLMKAFNKFVEEHLAVMIAAEDLGGPVVGDAADIDEETLKAGFTQGGKTRKKSSATKDDAKRIRRNRENWGSEEEEEADIENGIGSEREAAAASLRSLTEELLNASASGEVSPYVNIKDETAAVRFLVRAKVAEFHPNDARKLRLVDFSRDLDAPTSDSDHSST